MAKGTRTKPKVALAHEFLVHYGGAEKTFEAMADLFPDAPVYTAKYDPKNMPDSLNRRKIIAPKNTIVNKVTKYIFTFLMAPVFEGFDFSKYDMIISDGNTWNKGILTKPEQLHITYIHTPPRFLYKYSRESSIRDKWYFRLPFSYLDNILRLWDYTAAQRPDYIIANSKNVQRRVEKFYRRKATVINPPVGITEKGRADLPFELDKPYYCAIGRLAKYKNFHILVEAFNLLGIPLVVVGTGSEETQLKKMAGENILFTGFSSPEEKRVILENSLGLINPVEDEDFGMVPVEAMMCGIPVLVHKSGGHLETVVKGFNGMFFDEVSTEDLIAKMKIFDKAVRGNKFDKEKIKEAAQKYSEDRFKLEFKSFVDEKWEKFAGEADR